MVAQVKISGVLIINYCGTPPTRCIAFIHGVKFTTDSEIAQYSCTRLRCYPVWMRLLDHWDLVRVFSPTHPANHHDRCLYKVCLYIQDIRLPG